MHVGYIKESILNKDIHSQLSALKDLDCKKIYHDKPGPHRKRPEMEQLIRELRKDDLVVTWKLDRIGNSLKDFMDLMNIFKEIGADFLSINDNIDTRKKPERLFYKLITLLSEYEKVRSMEKTRNALPSAGKKRKGGRPEGLTGSSVIKAMKARKLYEESIIPVADIATSVGIGKTTLYRYLRYAGTEIGKNKIPERVIPEGNKEKSRIRQQLLNNLKESRAFWSFQNISPDRIQDDILIQKVMEELDIPDIRKLFIIFPENFIHKVWKDQMIPQDPYYRSLNILLAKLFFNIKKPEKYIQNVLNERNQ